MRRGYNESQIAKAADTLPGAGAGGYGSFFHKSVQKFLELIQLIHSFNGGQGFHRDLGQGGDDLLTG